MPQIDLSKLSKPARKAYDAWVKEIDEWEPPKDDKGNPILTLADMFPDLQRCRLDGDGTVQRLLDAFVNMAIRHLEPRPGNLTTPTEARDKMGSNLAMTFRGDFTPEREPLYRELIDQAVAFVANTHARAAEMAQQELAAAERSKATAQQHAAAGIANRLLSWRA